MWAIKIYLLALAMEAVTAAAVPVVRRRPANTPNSDCKLIFNIGQTPEGKPTVTGIKMPPLNTMLRTGSDGRNNDTMKESTICNLVFALNPVIHLGGSAKDPFLPTFIQSGKERALGREDAEDVALEDHKNIPIYEQQLAVWPTDIEDVVDALAVGEEQPQEQTMPLIEQQEVVYPPWLSQAPHQQSNIIPLYEDQLVVFPEVHFEEDDLMDWNETYDEVENEDEDENEEDVGDQGAPAVNQIKVLENFQVVHPNGTSEYKLALSNGLVNYKKIYTKLVNDKVVTVQEGYDSVPIAGQKNEFQTQYYIADEHGHNVYRVEHNYRRPELPNFLSYRDQMAAAQKAVN